MAAKPQKTKHYSRFLARVAHLDADIELVDIFTLCVKQGELNGTSRLFRHTSPDRHPRLSARKNTPEGRKLACQHLRRSVVSSFLKDLYEDTLLYMEGLLQSATARGLNPDRLIGDTKVEFTANDILQAGNWPNMIKLLSRQILRRIEQKKDTMEVFRQLNNKLALGVVMTTIDAALPYLEMRHLLIHGDGVIDDDFVKRFPSFKYKVGAKLSLRYELAQDAMAAVLKLVEEFDAKAVAAGVCGPEELCL